MGFAEYQLRPSDVSLNIALEAAANGARLGILLGEMKVKSSLGSGFLPCGCATADPCRR